MGFGKFLKKAVTMPFRAVKNTVKATGGSLKALAKGDLKGSVKAGLSAFKDFKNIKSTLKSKPKPAAPMAQVKTTAPPPVRKPPVDKDFSNPDMGGSGGYM